jgi:hypothetical protein
MFVQDYDLTVLNNKAEIDFFTSYNYVYRDSVINDDPYFGVQINSLYHDIDTLSTLCESQKSPILLSLNVQSLQSKYEQLCFEINEMLSKKINIAVIVL